MTYREKEALRRANAALHRRRELHRQKYDKKARYNARHELAYFLAVSALALLVVSPILLKAWNG